MKNLITRYAVFIFGLYLLTLGVVLIVKSSLGTSPISSLPYVVSLMTPITLGTAAFLLNMLLILGQLWFIRESNSRRDLIEILMQIPFSILFGYFIDFNMVLLSGIPVPTYGVQLGLLAIGCIVQALGVALELKPNVVIMSGEGFVKYASRRYSKNFGRLKVGVDVSLVILAVVTSLCMSRTIIGVREGTVISALVVGLLVNLINRHIISHIHLPNLLLSR